VADCTTVVSAYTELRDSLSALAIRSADPGHRNILLHRAAVSGSLAEQCDGKFSGRDVPGGGGAIDAAQRAIALATGASGQGQAEAREVIEAAEEANSILAAIVDGSSFGTSYAEAFVGSLRITPSRSALVRAHGNFAAAAAEKPKTATPGYITDVAKLFPAEAATLFPLGQSIAGKNPISLLIVILVTAAFVIVLRFFATQEDGKPSKTEIGGALISLLLWIGATKGFWVEGPGLIDSGMSASEGAALFGFVTIIWVALAPYIVKEKAKRDAAKDLADQVPHNASSIAPVAISPNPVIAKPKA
jgi:hypothetical protein